MQKRLLSLPRGRHLSSVYKELIWILTYSSRCNDLILKLGYRWPPIHLNQDSGRVNTADNFCNITVLPYFIVRKRWLAQRSLKRRHRPVSTMRHKTGWMPAEIFALSLCILWWTCRLVPFALTPTDTTSCLFSSWPTTRNKLPSDLRALFNHRGCAVAQWLDRQPWGSVETGREERRRVWIRIEFVFERVAS